MEHKAYTHRSGRTARAGNDGTVITLMTDEQVKEVQSLTRKAGVSPTFTRTNPNSPILDVLVPDRGTNTLRPIVRAEEPTGQTRGRPQPRQQAKATTASPDAKRRRNRRRRPAQSRTSG